MCVGTEGQGLQGAQRKKVAKIEQSSHEAKDKRGELERHGVMSRKQHDCDVTSVYLRHYSACVHTGECQLHASSEVYI